MFLSVPGASEAFPCALRSKFSIRREDKLQPDGSPCPPLGSTIDSFRKPLLVRDTVAISKNKARITLLMTQQNRVNFWSEAISIKFYSWWKLCFFKLWKDYCIFLVATLHECSPSLSFKSQDCLIYFWCNFKKCFDFFSSFKISALEN